jgi:predicted amidohydrolase
VQVWDLRGIGRIAIIICFDVNFMELWHQAYALGAQIVFWPSIMATPDRDAISAARLFRYHIVANGWSTSGGPADLSLPGVPERPFYSPGTVLDSTGRTVEDFHLIGKIGCPCCTPCPSSTLNTTASIGTMDLDATWVHENLPGPQQCPGVARLCAAHPGVFELPVGGCGHPATNFSRCHILGGGNAKYCSGLAHCKSGVPPPGVSVPGDSTMDGPSVFLVRSTTPETHSVRAALREFGVLPYRDGIFAARQGVNSLRQTVSTGGTCSFPDKGEGGAPSFDRPVTCQPGTVDNLTRGGSFTLAPAASTNPTPANDTHMYVDAKAMVYDMESIVSSSSNLVNSTSGQVKVAVGIQSTDLPSLTAELKLAKTDGAQIALLTEENFGDAAEPLDGPHVMELRAVAKSLSLFIILPFRLSLGKGRNFNAAVVIDKGGALLNSTTGNPYYQKIMPSSYFPHPTRRPSLPNDYGEGVIPGKLGVQAWDLPGIGRIAIFICFDINFFELWHQAYALGAQAVFWPSAMQTPDRDMISLARLYRYHIVANGYPGDIINGMGRQVDDFKALPGGARLCKNTPDKTIHDCGVRTGTLDLDATWVHDNGPGPLNCPAIAAMCKAHPGVFELAIPGCGHLYNHPKACAAGCTCGKVAPGETVKNDNSVFLVRSKQPEKFPVRTAFRRHGVVPYHDFIKGSRQGLNALRQARADIPRPPAGTGKPGSTPFPMPSCPTIIHENVCVLPLCEWQSGNCVISTSRTSAPRPPHRPHKTDDVHTAAATTHDPLSLPVPRQCTASAGLPPAECAAWMELFDSTRGPQWVNCSGSRLDPCGCSSGVTCANGRVTALKLHNNNLNGTLPPSLRALTALTDLRLYYNSLVGTIPPGLSTLTALTTLNLEGNRLAGSIPASLARLRALTELNLSHNQLAGAISPSLSALTALTLLSLDHNLLTGTIPPELSALTAVTYFSLYNNRLTGEIPASLSKLTAVTIMSLNGNRLTGAVPALPFAQYSGFCCLQLMYGPPSSNGFNSNRFSCPLPAGANLCVGNVVPAGAPSGYLCNTTCT